MLRKSLRAGLRLANGILRDKSSLNKNRLPAFVASFEPPNGLEKFINSQKEVSEPWRLQSFQLARFSAAPAASHQLSNLKEFRLAQTGEGIQECELVRWFVQEGDPVEEFGHICEVQSDKATIEITSPYAGVVKKLHHSVGDVVPVGDILAEILTDSTATESSSSLTESEAAEATKIENFALPSPTADVLTSPAVRRLAQELHVDLAAVVPSGPGGRITKSDVMAFVEAQQNTLAPSSYVASLEAPEPPPVAAYTSINNTPIQSPMAEAEPPVIPLRGYRKAMFKSMTAAASIPHFHYCDEVCFDALVDLRSRLQGSPTLHGTKLTYLPFLIKAAALALKENPMINCSLSPANDSLIQHPHINIGIAVATPFGLVVPNIKNVESLSIAHIARELSRLQTAALANQLRPDDISGGTFTISNIGVVGGTYATPLINPPEVSIMALGQIKKLPRFGSDGVTVQPTNMLSVSLGADHRVVDGATLAGFGVLWKQLVEDPGRLLLELR